MMFMTDTLYKKFLLEKLRSGFQDIITESIDFSLTGEDYDDIYDEEPTYVYNDKRFRWATKIITGFGKEGTVEEGHKSIEFDEDAPLYPGYRYVRKTFKGKFKKHTWFIPGGFRIENAYYCQSRSNNECISLQTWDFNDDTVMHHVLTFFPVKIDDKYNFTLTIMKPDSLLSKTYPFNSLRHDYPDFPVMSQEFRDVMSGFVREFYPGYKLD